ncbi:MAG: hypothetical protein MJ126_10050 [Lachnospiraceae bacterium]|nr:hypothetical protein [Lachnospiraceae bacterium]
MKDNLKFKINTILFAGLILLVFVFSVLLPKKDISSTERRKLKQMPKLTVEAVFTKKGSSSFMDEFELYAKDQFPMREVFRSINATTGRYLLGRQEINNLYVYDGYISKMEESLSEEDYVWSVSRIESIIDKYVDDNKVYMSIIPDKNYYAAPEAGYPYIDMDEFERKYKERLLGKVYFIDIKDKLKLSDYYRTDTHWRQEQITDISEYILAEMGKEVTAEYESNALDGDFYGVYYGQAALPMKAEKLNYISWDGMENIRVYNYESGSPVEISMYDYDAVEGMDPYELYLYGSKSLLTIENDDAEDGELIIFRDSFGSSIAPLMSLGYKKITLVDIRYISPSMLDRFVDFENADILFLYSTTVLNNSVGQFIK